MAQAKDARSALDRPTTNDLACRWYLAEDGQKEGPITYDELARRAREGRLHGGQYVWRPGFEQWIAVSARSDLTSLMPERPSLGLVPPSLEAADNCPTDELRWSRDIIQEEPVCDTSDLGDLGMLVSTSGSPRTSASASLEAEQFLQGLRRARRNRLLVVLVVALFFAVVAVVLAWTGVEGRAEDESVSPKVPKLKAPVRETGVPIPEHGEPVEEPRTAVRNARASSDSKPVPGPELSKAELAVLSPRRAPKARAPTNLVSHTPVAPRRYRLRAPEPEVDLTLPIALPDGLSDEGVGQVVSAGLSRFSRCARFDRLSRRLPPGSAVTFEVDHQGRVKRPQARGAPREVAACLERAARGLIFRPFKRPRERIEVRFARAGTVRPRIIR